jgi:hypothetical protein
MPGLARPETGSYDRAVVPPGNRALAIGFVAIVLGHAGAARADDAAEAKALATRAVEAAGEGRSSGDKTRFAEAVSLFKRAFRLDPDPEYQCNIGIAYRDHGDLAQAHLFLGRCITRMGGASAERKSALRNVHASLETRLREAGFVPVDIASKPAGATVQVSAFADDDTFPAPWQVWLPPGEHTIAARAAGFAAAEEKISVQAGAPSRSLTIALTREVAVPEPAKPEPAKPEPTTPEGAVVTQLIAREAQPARGRGLGLGVLGAGLGVAAGGALFHVLAYRNIQRIDDDDLRGEAYDDVAGTARTQRALALGLYAVGAVGTAVGLYLVVGRRGSSETRISIAPPPTGTGGVAWISFSP